MNHGLASNGPKKWEPIYKYKKKYQNLKKYIIRLICENASLCDQVTYLQDKILHVKEENNFLIKKLKHLDFIRSASGNEINSPDLMTKKFKKKMPVYMNQDTVLPKMPMKMKKQVNKSSKKKQTLPVSEEVCGQLIFPITLNYDLTIQSLGEIVTDSSSYHTEDIIYPVGYVSTKIYGSIFNPKVKCSYACKIMDGGIFPIFEISAEGGRVFTGTSPDECHQKLLTLINENYSAKVVNESITCGADFFGLTNTTVHYLILSLPGVSKCLKYNFKKFNERITMKDDVLLKDDMEACLDYNALLKVLPESFSREHYNADAWLSGQ